MIKIFFMIELTYMDILVNQKMRTAFFAVLAVVAAEATQAVGALLLLGLLAAPGGAARLLTDNPWRGLALSAALALASMWGGLALSYEVASLPPSFAVMLVAPFLLIATMIIAARLVPLPMINEGVVTVVTFH